MPRTLVERALDEFCVETGSLGARTLVPDKRDTAIRSLSATFDVNPVVARIRLEEIFPAKDDGQLSL